MFGMDRLEILFVIWAFLFQLVLIAHFALRKWRFATAMRIGPFVYVLGFPAAIISLLLLLGGKSWWVWLGGFLCLAWGIFGYTIEYIKKIQWRNPPLWQVFVPYLFLYLSTLMFYWWPLKLLYRPLWFAYTLLFIISTVLNTTSHHAKQSMEVG